MGINGLLKVLSPLLIPENEIKINGGKNNKSMIKSKSSPKYNIRQFANKSLAIDASSWLYKASYSCAERLVESIEENRIDPICEHRLCTYMTSRCDELLNNAYIQHIILVFDGKRCPLKEATNKEREMKRQENLKEARRLKKMGNVELAGDKYRACVKVTPWMAECVEKAIKKKWRNYNGNNFYAAAAAAAAATVPKVSCVFSPYEADAQLIKLCMDGFADAIVTEDSDVLVYSAACNIAVPIIYKLSRDDGSCDVISMDWLISPESSSTHSLSSYNIHGYPSIRRKLLANANNNNKVNSKKEKRQSTGSGSALLQHLVAMSAREKRQKGSGARMFVQSCVLAGCDYVPNRLAGVGIITAFKLIKENAHRDVESRFLHVLNSFPKEKILSDEIIQHNDEVKRNVAISIKREDVSHIVHNYETLLAKSEAVFYYHLVKNIKTGDVVPLLPPSLLETKNALSSSDTSNDNDDINKFLPLISRFDGDLSFTGINDSRSVDRMALLAKSNDTKTSCKDITNPYTAKTKKSQDKEKKLIGYLCKHVKPTEEASKTLSTKCETVMSSKYDNGISKSNTNISIIDLDSLDDLDDGKENYDLPRPIITPSFNDSRISTKSSTFGISSSSKQIIKSKYFTFDNNTKTKDSCDRMEDLDKDYSLSLPMVTPEATVGSRSDEETSKQGESDIDDVENDSTDCMIIDNPFSTNNNMLPTKSTSFLGKSRPNFFARFQNTSHQEKQKQFRDNSTFSKAQSQGTREKVGHYSSTKNKRKPPRSTALVKNKRSKNYSIVNYFCPLDMRKQK